MAVYFSWNGNFESENKRIYTYTVGNFKDKVLKTIRDTDRPVRFTLYTANPTTPHGKGACYHTMKQDVEIAPLDIRRDHSSIFYPGDTIARKIHEFANKVMVWVMDYNKDILNRGDPDEMEDLCSSIDIVSDTPVRCTLAKITDDFDYSDDEDEDDD